MKNLFFALIIVFMNNNVFAQDFWEITNAPTAATFRTFYTDINGNMIGGATGVYKSTNNGYDWISLNRPWPNVQAVHSILVDSLNDYFAGVGWEGIYKSTNEGISWQKVNSSVQIRSLKMDSQGNIFAGDADGDLFKSSDNGESWINLTNGNIMMGIDAIAIDSNDEIFIASYTRIFKTTDEGTNWIEISNGLSDFQIYTLVMDNTGNLFVGTLGGIYKSSDRGENWYKFSNGLDNTIILQLLVTPEILYAATLDSGVYKLSNDNWVNISNGLTTLTIASLAITPDDYLLAGSLMAGIFRSINPITDIKSDSKNIYNFTLEQNYPNPFNPLTTIRYSISENDFVELKIYNMLGEEITMLIAEEKQAGSYEVNFDCKDLTNGIYFYQLKSGEYSYTRKMILLK